MDGTTNTKPFANFAPGADRDLLAEVHRWARHTGWTWYEAWGWVSGNDLDHAAYAVDWDSEARTVTVRRNDGNGIYRPTVYPADTVREALDVLAAYGVVAPKLSTVYRSGWLVGYAEGVIR
jgi:hypothetical protein